MLSLCAAGSDSTKIHTAHGPRTDSQARELASPSAAVTAAAAAAAGANAATALRATSAAPAPLTPACIDACLEDIQLRLPGVRVSPSLLRQRPLSLSLSLSPSRQSSQDQAEIDSQLSTELHEGGFRSRRRRSSDDCCSSRRPATPPRQDARLQMESKEDCSLQGTRHKRKPLWPEDQAAARTSDPSRQRTRQHTNPCQQQPCQHGGRPDPPRPAKRRERSRPAAGMVGAPFRPEVVNPREPLGVRPVIARDFRLTAPVGAGGEIFVGRQKSSSATATALEETAAAAIPRIPGPLSHMPEAGLSSANHDVAGSMADQADGDGAHGLPRVCSQTPLDVKPVEAAPPSLLEASLKLQQLGQGSRGQSGDDFCGREDPGSNHGAGFQHRKQPPLRRLLKRAARPARMMALSDYDLKDTKAQTFGDPLWASSVGCELPGQKK